MDLSKYHVETLEADGQKLLDEFRERVPILAKRVREESAEAAALEKLTIWRVDIEAKSEAADIVLLKYLRAEELNLDKAQERLTQTLIFRYDCRIDDLRDAELPDYFLGHDFISGVDDKGRPVMISRFGTMDIDKVFADAEAFVRYRARLMEQAITKLKFKGGFAEDLVQIHDYSGVISSMYKPEVKAGVSAVSQVFSEHYPELKGKTMFVNFPGIFAKPFKAFALLLPERTRNKFMILGYEDHLLLFENVDPQYVPESIGGLYRDNVTLSVDGKVANPKARAKEEVLMLELDHPATVTWEVRVAYAEIAFEVAFIGADGGKEVIASRDANNLLQSTEGVITGEWTGGQDGQNGKMVCTFDNAYAWFKSRVCVCRAAVLTK